MRYAESLESITELQNENYDLVDDMNTLQEAVDDLEEQLSQTQTRCNEATAVSEKILALSCFFVLHDEL